VLPEDCRSIAAPAAAHLTEFFDPRASHDAGA